MMPVWTMCGKRYIPVTYSEGIEITLNTGTDKKRQEYALKKHNIGRQDSTDYGRGRLYRRESRRTVAARCRRYQDRKSVV